MRILIYSLNTAPEPIGIGKYTGEMAAWLATRGHEVRVVAAPPYYPGWRVAKGYRGWWYARETLDGVDVRRCPLWVPRRPTGMTRVLHLLTFALTSFPVALWQALAWRPAILVAVAPAMAAAPGAWLAARLGRSRAWLHVQDFELDAAFGLDLLKPGTFGRAALALERFVLRRFDRVSSISARMCGRLRDKGVPAGRIAFLPNWVDTDTIHPQPLRSPLRWDFGIDAGTTVALYAGNMGRKQGLEALVEAAKALSDMPDLIFVFAGDGAGRPSLEAAAAGLDNVRFLPVQPPDRLNALLNLADIHLLPQRPGAADLVMPSKLTGMFASGRPVVAQAPPGSQLAETVEDRGLVVPPEDGAAFAAAIARLSGDPEARSRFGQAAREFAVATWRRDAVLEDFERALDTLAPQSDAALEPHEPDSAAAE